MGSLNIYKMRPSPATLRSLLHISQTVIWHWRACGRFINFI